jgi:hypothetical protein
LRPAAEQFFGTSWAKEVFMTRTVYRSLFAATLSAAIMFAWVAARAADPGAPPSAEQPAPKLSDKAELEKQFAQSLTGATLVGYHTERTADKENAPQESRYTLTKVAQIKDELWLFEAHIQYAEHDLTVPVPLRVVWAGDTPVITLDKLTLPGLGTFTCRVLIYDNQYAGIWSSDKHRGELCGRVVKENAKDKTK